jgi:hypothetical protein
VSPGRPGNKGQRMGRLRNQFNLPVVITIVLNSRKKGRSNEFLCAIVTLNPFDQLMAGWDLQSIID